MAKELANLEELLQKYLDNTISPAELNLFWKLVTLAPEGDPVHSSLHDLWMSTPVNYKSQDASSDHAAMQHIRDRSAFIEMQQMVLMKRKRNWLVAASVLIFITAGLFLATKNTNDKTSEIAVVSDQKFRHCIGCATLTLSDGSVIELDSAASGNLANEGAAKISKTSKGQLAYRAAASRGAGVYNSVATPRGGTHQVTLSDGTKVWLNAASSIRFPVVFTGSERKVEATGEVFFDVSPNSNLPFKVIFKECEIMVLGTSFNINGYEDEESLKTTLVEGSIRMNVNDRSQLLKPGQQIAYNRHTKNIILGQGNVEEATAWKEGFFYFDNVNIQTVLREIGRWYNVNIIYEGNIPARGFTGELGRDLSLTDVVGFLKKSKVNVTIQDNALIIKP